MCEIVVVFFFFKQKTAYEMRISDWSSDVCSSDLPQPDRRSLREFDQADQDDDEGRILDEIRLRAHPRRQRQIAAIADADRSEVRRVGKEGVSKCRYRWAPVH